MTKISLDPSSLHLFFPKSSPAHPLKVRLLAQVEFYDYTSANLRVKKFPNLPLLHTQINIDEPPDDSDYTIDVDVSYVVEKLLVEEASVGLTVSIIGFYDGSAITAVECVSLEALCLHGRSLQTLTKYASMLDINK